MATTARRFDRISEKKAIITARQFDRISNKRRSTTTVLQSSLISKKTMSRIFLTISARISRVNKYSLPILLDPMRTQDGGNAIARDVAILRLIEHGKTSVVLALFSNKHLNVLQP